MNYNYIYNKPKNLVLLVCSQSKRNIDQGKQGCEEIFVSSIFHNQKSKNYLGIIKFNLLASKTKHKIIALGGINEKNYKKLKSTLSDGFASISWAKKNGLRKLRPLL